MCKYIFMLILFLSISTSLNVDARYLESNDTSLRAINEIEYYLQEIDKNFQSCKESAIEILSEVNYKSAAL